MSVPTTPTTTESVAFSIAAWLAGAGIIGAVLYFTVVPMLDLLMFALYWILPLLLIGVGLGLISGGTVSAFKAFMGSTSLSSRVQEWTRILRENPNTPPPVPRAHNVPPPVPQQ